jgi:hypothetical protein
MRDLTAAREMVKPEASERRHCVCCGIQFEIAASERAFFEANNLHQPRRCRECRAARRAAAER